MRVKSRRGHGRRKSGAPLPHMDHVAISTRGLLVQQARGDRSSDALVRSLVRSAQGLQTRPGVQLACLTVHLAAASLGSIDSLTTAAIYIRDGIEDHDGTVLLEAQPSVAHQMFAHAARRGCVSAMASMAFGLHAGIGCSRDRPGALRLWRRAAKGGSVVAATNAGLEYLEEGKWSLAKRYFAMALEMGDPEAAVGYARSCIGSRRNRAGLLEAEGVLRGALRKSKKSWSPAGREEGEALLDDIREQLRSAPAGRPR